jgi:hypothetical protein
MAALGVFLNNEDFELQYIYIVDDVNGRPQFHIVPYSINPDMHLAARRQNPEWVARFTPIMDLINNTMLHNEKVQMRTTEMEAAMRDDLRRNPLASAHEIEQRNAATHEEASFELGQAVNDSHPFTSPLLLMKMINDPDVTLQEYDQFVADEKLKDELGKLKDRRKNSIGETEMKVDAELPFGSREQVERETARRAMTLAQRAQAAQAAAGNPLGYPAPIGPQPHWPVDDSDTVTVRHFGPGGAGASRTGRGKPSELLDIAKESYKKGAAKKIGDAELVKETDTLKFYKKGNEIIIGVRGTKDLSDAVASLSLGARSKAFLQVMPRLRGDIAEIREFQKQYPPSAYHYSGVGHSLGGALIDEFVSQNLISEGQSYNPAVHRADLYEATNKNRRIYTEGDPLYSLGSLVGQTKYNTEVRESKPLPAHASPPSLPDAFSEMLRQHRITNPALEGGAAGGSSSSSSDPIDYPYSDADIRAVLGSVPIHKYPELKGMATPDALFKGNKAAILLFLTEGKNSGHWIVVLDHDTHYEVFDSFGMAIDGNRKWLDKEKLLEFGQTLPLLSNLLGRGQKPVDHNTTKLQADDADTCGRWVVWRVKNAHMPLKTFVAEMKQGPSTPDQNVVRSTFDLLGK